MSEKNFNVYTITEVDQDGPMYTHWSDGLKMHITKNGVEIELDEHEIQLLMRAMPKTIGGSY